MRRFLRRIPEGGGQVPSTVPTSLPGLLWWDDPASIVGGVDGSPFNPVPVFPGTPTTASGVDVRLGTSLVGAGIYRTGVLPSGAPLMDYRDATGHDQQHLGPAFRDYAVNNAGAGLTIYLRWWQYAWVVGASFQLMLDSPVGASTLFVAAAPPASTLSNTFVVGGTGLTASAAIPILANQAYTLAIVLPSTGSYSVYLNGALRDSPTAGTVKISTSAAGLGARVGDPLTPNANRTGISAFLAYQALHTSAQVIGVSNWLLLHR